MGQKIAAADIADLARFQEILLGVFWTLRPTESTPLVGSDDSKPKIELKTFKLKKRDGFIPNMMSLSLKTKK